MATVFIARAWFLIVYTFTKLTNRFSLRFNSTSNVMPCKRHARITFPLKCGHFSTLIWKGKKEKLTERKKIVFFIDTP